MCFDHDSRPPIPPIEGGALDAQDVVLEAADGNRFMAYLARAAEPSGTGMVVLPDVRGLHAYYRDLALRFAEHGIDAIAIDYFGRTAGIGDRGPDFDHSPHVPQTTYEGLRADVTAAVEHLRAETDVERVFTVGFCFGGRLAFLSAGFGLGLDGVIGFYGVPGRTRAERHAGAGRRGDRVRVARSSACSAARTRPSPRTSIAALETALRAAGVEHRIVTYEGAPHSFFDRKHDEFAEASAAAWDEVLAFTGGAGDAVSFLRRILGGNPQPVPATDDGGRPDPDPDSGRDGRPGAGPAWPTSRRATGSSCARRPSRLDDELIQRQLRYADRSWTPPAQGGERRADDEEAKRTSRG